MGGAKILCSGARGPLEHTAKTTRREEQLRSGAYRTVRRSVTVDSQVLGLRFRDAARDAGADTSRGRRDAKYHSADGALQRYLAMERVKPVCRWWRKAHFVSTRVIGLDFLRQEFVFISRLCCRRSR